MGSRKIQGRLYQGQVRPQLSRSWAEARRAVRKAVARKAAAHKLAADTGLAADTALAVDIPAADTAVDTGQTAGIVPAADTAAAADMAVAADTWVGRFRCQNRCYRYCFRYPFASLPPSVNMWHIISGIKRLCQQIQLI